MDHWRCWRFCWPPADQSRNHPPRPAPHRCRQPRQPANAYSRAAQLTPTSRLHAWLCFLCPSLLQLPAVLRRRDGRRSGTGWRYIGRPRSAIQCHDGCIDPGQLPGHRRINPWHAPLRAWHTADRITDPVRTATRMDLLHGTAWRYTVPHRTVFWGFGDRAAICQLHGQLNLDPGAGRALRAQCAHPYTHSNSNQLRPHLPPSPPWSRWQWKPACARRMAW